MLVVLLIGWNWLEMVFAAVEKEKKKKIKYSEAGTLNGCATLSITSTTRAQEVFPMKRESFAGFIFLGIFMNSIEWLQLFLHNNFNQLRILIMNICVN